MKINLLHNYKGLPSNYEKLLAGVHDLTDELAFYLVENGHAEVVIEKPSVADVTAEAPEESASNVKNKRKRL